MKIYKRLKDIHLLNHSFKWSAPSIVETIGRLLSTSVTIAVLLKVEFGFLGVGIIVFTYLGFLQFGVTDALMLELPKKYIKNQYLSMKNDTEVSMSFIIINYFIFGPIIAIGGLVFSIDNNLITIITVYYFTSILYQVYLHHILINRFMYDFNVVAYARYMNAITRGVFQSLAVYYYGLNGFLFIESILYIIPIILLRKYGQFILSFKLDLGLLKKYLSIGFPLFIIAVLGVLSSTVDRWFATAIDSYEGMASFSFIGFMATLLLFIPNQTLSIFSQYSREYLATSAENSKDTLFSHYISYGIFFTAIFGIVGVISIDIAYYTIKYFLPEYIDVLQLLPIVVIVIMQKISISTIRNYCIITGMQNIVLYNNLYSIMFIILSNSVLLYFNFLTAFNIVLISAFAVFLQYIYILYKLNKIQLSIFTRHLYIFGFLIIFVSANCYFEYIIQPFNPIIFNSHIWIIYTITFLSLFCVWAYRDGVFDGLLLIARRKY